MSAISLGPETERERWNTSLDEPRAVRPTCDPSARGRVVSGHPRLRVPGSTGASWSPLPRSASLFQTARHAALEALISKAVRPTSQLAPRQCPPKTLVPIADRWFQRDFHCLSSWFCPNVSVIAISAPRCRESAITAAGTHKLDAQLVASVRLGALICACAVARVHVNPE